MTHRRQALRIARDAARHLGLSLSELRGLSIYDILAECERSPGCTIMWGCIPALVIGQII